MLPGGLDPDQIASAAGQIRFGLICPARPPTDQACD
jgi:hypothetical protein